MTSLSRAERGAVYDAAERASGGSFWDLSPEERGHYYGDYSELDTWERDDDD